MSRTSLRAVAVLAACLVGCDSSPPAPTVAPEAPREPVTDATRPTRAPAPEPGPVPTAAWLLEPRTDADRALLRRLLEPTVEVRQDAAREWEAARVENRSAVGKLAGGGGRAPQDKPEDWTEVDDASPTVGEAGALLQAFENRMRALARGLIGALRDGDVATRVAAADSIHRMHLALGRHLVRALADADPEVRVVAAKAMSGLTREQGQSPAHLAAICKLLHDPDWRVRDAGVSGVVSYWDRRWELKQRFDDNPVVSRLIALSADEPAELRGHALWALARLRPYGRNADVEAAFVARLADPSPGVRARAVGWFGQRTEPPDSKPCPPAVVETLRRLLVSPEKQDREAAAYAVWRTTLDSSGLVGIFADEVAEKRGWHLQGPLSSLTEIGPDAEAAVPSILSVLTEDTALFTNTPGDAVLEALYSIGPRAETTLPLLEPMLSDSDPARRREAARAVATLYGDGAACDAVLARALERETDALVRATIHMARADIGAGGDALMAALIAALSAPDWEREGALRGLTSMGRRAVAAVPRLEEMVADDRLTRGQSAGAAVALAAVGGPARAAAMLPRIRSRIGEHGADRVLDSVGPADAALAPELLEHLDASPLEIARALAEIGPAARDALPALERRVAGPDGPERIVAAEAVLRIGGDRDAALKVLIDAVARGVANPDTDRGDHPGQRAAWAIARVGSIARPAEDQLKLAAGQRNLEFAAAAAFALWRLGGGADACRDALVACTKSHTPMPSVEFVEALGAMGPAAVRATAELERIALEWRRVMWKDDAAIVARAAIRALGEIGPGAASTLPTLRQFARNALFRAAAEEAIRRIE